MLADKKSRGLGPTLYHLAAGEAWPGICKYGLLSSDQLYKLFRLDPSHVLQIETERLQRADLRDTPEHVVFTLRDRTTLTHKGLTAALNGSCTPGEWIELLNRRVFLFAQKSSLDRLIRAPLNRELSHVILELDTRKLLDRHQESIEVADINTGYTKRSPAQRNPSTIQSIGRYVKTGSRKIVEVTIPGSIPDILPLLQRAVLRKPCGTEHVLHGKENS